MRQYKIIARILLILPIINFAMALPMAVQETRQACGDITMSAKRGDEMEKWDMNFERLSGKPESSLAAHRPSGSARSEPESDDGPINAPRQSPRSESSTAPDHGSMDPQAPQMDTSEVSLGLLKSPSLSHYLVPTDPESKSFLSNVLSKLKFCCSTTKPRAVWEPDCNSAAEKPPPQHTYGDHHTT
jgi:hypothetical protein